MDVQHVAPAVTRRGPKKSEDPRAEDRAWAEALRATLGNPNPVPVLWQGRCLGFVRGSYAEPLAAWWRPLAPGERWWETALIYRAAWTSYDAIVTSLVSGKKLFRPWNKTATTNPVAGNWYDLWPVGGNPPSGAYGGAAYTATQRSETTTGAIWNGGNVSTDTKAIVSAVAWASAGATPPTLYFVDRVLDYHACSFNASVNQAFTNGVAAQRYIGTGERGLQVSITAQTALGATAANLTQLQYTDNDGNTLQSAPVAVANAVIVSAAAPTSTLGARVVCPSITAATTAVARVYPLLSGDSGVRLLANFTTSAANTGTLCFVLHRELFIAPTTTAGFSAQIDGVIQIAGLERVIDGACVQPFAFFPAATGANLGTHLTFAWG